MIYICADDYGLCDSASAHIQHCIDNGGLNKVSVFPNLDPIDLNKITENKNVIVSLHLNLVEGRCMSDASKAGLIADENGNLKHAFGGLLKQSILHPKLFEEQIYNEIKAQVSYWKSIIPEDMAFRIDGHQHTQMIPAVFNTLVRVLDEENIHLKHMRVPAEPLSPFIKTPSLYFTYSPINIVKQWVLKFLWQINKREAKKHHIPTAYFFGILLSGKMDIARVEKILPKYIKLAEKHGRDVEILFHPGYLEKGEEEFESKNVAFKKFYLSENRKTEFDSVMKLSERSVM